MRYLVTARVKAGREADLLRAIEDGTLGAGSVAGDEYFRNMEEARLVGDRAAYFSAASGASELVTSALDGSARRTLLRITLTRPGTIVGSVDYMAPERIRGAPADSASDVYALGCVVFESLTGQAPFQGKTLFEVAGSILGDAPPDPCAARDDAAPELGAAVLMALAKDPQQRPATATAYANLLTVAQRSP